ncbi:MAG: ankyrin repeat domain-containing protein [Myxococcota bacterium]
MSEPSLLTQRCARALEDLEPEEDILELIDEGAELEQLLPCFRYAVEIGGEELVRHFLDAGAEPDAPLDDDDDDDGDESALSLAARLDSPEIVGILLEQTSSHDRQTLREPLRAAIEHGSYESAALLARTMTHEVRRGGAGPLALDDTNRSAAKADDFKPLVLVAYYGWDTVARSLIARGHSADERARMVDRETQSTYEDVPALVAAAMAGHLSMVELLLAAGADASVTDDGGRTAVDYARDHGNRTMQRRLAGDDREEPSVDTLHRAAQRGDLQEVQRAIEAGVDVDGTMDQGPSRDHSALSLAAGAGQSEAVDALLRAGASPDHPPRHPPLVEASSEGHVEVVRTLLRAGAALQARNLEGDDALFCAVGADEAETALVLIEAGADVDAFDLEGQTPLAIASSYGTKPVVEALLLYGADPRAIDREGESILERLNPGANRELYALIEQAAAKADAAGRPITDGHPCRQRMANMKREMQAVDLRRYDCDDVFARLQERLSTSGFQKVAEQLHRELGAKPQPLSSLAAGYRVPGLAFQIPRMLDVAELVERHTSPDALLFGLSEGRYAGRTTLALLATHDPLEAISAFAPAGPNDDVSDEDVLRWAVHVYRAHPFRLTYLHHDLLEGTFTDDLPDPEFMAQRVYEICPDAVGQAAGSIEAVAESLAKRRLALWWD